MSCEIAQFIIVLVRIISVYLTKAVLKKKFLKTCITCLNSLWCLLFFPISYKFNLGILCSENVN